MQNHHYQKGGKQTNKKEGRKNQYLQGDSGCNKTKSIFTNSWMTNNCNFFESRGILVCDKNKVKYHIGIYISKKYQN